MSRRPRLATRAPPCSRSRSRNPDHVAHDPRRVTDGSSSRCVVMWDQLVPERSRRRSSRRSCRGAWSGALAHSAMLAQPG